MTKTLDVLNRGIDQGLHPGAGLYVRHRGAVVIDKAVGRAWTAGPFLTTNTRMLWMSAGKPVTAIAILQQIEKGRATLDTRLSELIPAFAHNGKAAITIRHLLTHTAGFRGPLNSFTPGPWEAIIERCCALKQEPNWTPGSKAGYHVASSWFMLGELVRLLDGRPFGQYVREAVFAPVGANHCTIGVDVSDVDGTESLVHPDFAGNQPVDAWTVSRPPANAQGPINELAMIYDSLQHHDGRLLTPPMSKLMVSRQREGMFDETFKEKVDWGLGVKLDSKRYGKPEQYGYGPHASDDTFGHSGNQCSCAFADPKQDLIVAWCTNGMPGEVRHQARQNAINAAIYEDLGLATIG